MTSTLRTNGYITDVGYTAGFYPETAPAHLAFAALVNGRAPGGAWRPRRVLELGFGQGFGLALLAAANPDIAFEGCDFNAGHVTHARGLIAAAGLTNLTVTESSFEAVANEAQTRDSDVDVVLLHGILSWVAQETEDAILAILRRRLRHDGVLYVSYNCLPGWAPLAPIRQLILDIKRMHAGGSEAQIASALDLLARLKQGHAAYFANNPLAAAHLDSMLGQDRAYLAHEYLDDHWRLFQFSDVAARLSRADDLGYIASATLTENFDQFGVPADLLQLIAHAGDPVLQETLRDLAANKMFRRDVFGRGGEKVDAAERRRLLAQMRFTLAVPRSRLLFRFLGPLNELIGREDFYAPIVDRLAQGVAGFEELLALPAFGESAVDRLVECLALLIHSQQVLPVIASPSVDRELAQQFNRMVVAQARAGRLYHHLASPVTGTGVRVDDFGLLTLAAVFDGKAEAPTVAAQHGLSIIKALGRRPMDQGKSIDDDNKAVEFLVRRMAPIMEDDVPLWQSLGMV